MVRYYWRTILVSQTARMTRIALAPAALKTHNHLLESPSEDCGLIVYSGW